MKLIINRGKASGKAITITSRSFLIGRDSACQLRPLSEEVSPRHAELRIRPGLAMIADLGSANGTRVNGRRLTGPVSLRSGDRIEIGPLSVTAMLEEQGRPWRKRGLSEDQIAAWLSDESEGAEEDPGLEPGAEGSRPQSARGDRRAAAEADSAAFDLLKEMSVRRG
ncbi:FHA domain-containing protein [Singulisphaera sp. PoT]|uniref:FHA domain-containing protein n=1 Tax=Singulisphaera sp. PoT TaxID=3411797 RepID=UPI003BF5A324